MFEYLPNSLDYWIYACTDKHTKYGLLLRVDFVTVVCSLYSYICLHTRSMCVCIPEYLSSLFSIPSLVMYVCQEICTVVRAASVQEVLSGVVNHASYRLNQHMFRWSLSPPTAILNTYPIFWTLSYSVSRAGYGYSQERRKKKKPESMSIVEII